MSFLTVIWLGALAALVVPVALHLVSRGHQRRLRVGTVRLLRAGTSFRARRLRPSQLFLMLVRCLLLAALALALAEPQWWRDARADVEQGWILASPSILARREAGDSELRAALDGLAADGHEVRLLAPGWTHTRPGRGAGPALEGPADVWSLLREADRAAGAGLPFFVFADDRATVLRGARPTLRRRVEWTALEVGRESAPDGGPERPGPPAKPLLVTLRFASDRQDDAWYVTAALAASAEHLEVSLALDAAQVDGAEGSGREWPVADLGVWLAAEPVPRTAFEASRIVLSDGLARHESCPRQVVFGRRPIELRRCSQAERIDGEAVLWTDGPARPLLAASRLDGAMWYRLHGRFHPLWSDLVLDTAFPEWLVELLDRALPRPRLAAAATLEVRAAAPGQALPRIDETPETPAARRPGRAVELWLWGAAAGLFALERRMALTADAFAGARTA